MEARRLADAQLAVASAALQLLDQGESRRAQREPPWAELGARRPDTATVQAALHLLFLRLNGRAAAKRVGGAHRKGRRARRRHLCPSHLRPPHPPPPAAPQELRGCWPITESGQHKEFRAAMHAWVKGLAAAGRLPPAAARHFVVAYQTWGARTVELLFHLALLALEAELERAYPGALAASAPGVQQVRAWAAGPLTCGGAMCSILCNCQPLAGAHITHPKLLP